jgi:hypothetical protein
MPAVVANIAATSMLFLMKFMVSPPWFFGPFTV